MNLSNVHNVEAALAQVFAGAVASYDHPTALAGLSAAISKVWVGLIISQNRTNLDLFEGLLGDVSVNSRKAHEIHFNEELPLEQKLWQMSQILLNPEEISQENRLELGSMLLAQRFGMDISTFDPDGYNDSESASLYLEALEKLREFVENE